MTPEEINEAVARKLGVYPTEKDLEWAKSQTTGGGEVKIIIADYCHFIAAAWEIVEKLATDNQGRVEVCHQHNALGTTFWECMIRRTFIGTDEKGLPIDILATADTAPMAICLAFLKIPDA